MMIYGITLSKFVGGGIMLEHKHDDLLEKVIEQNENQKSVIEYH